jgi:hypothetical protein
MARVKAVELEETPLRKLGASSPTLPPCDWTVMVGRDARHRPGTQHGGSSESERIC